MAIAGLLINLLILGALVAGGVALVRRGQHGTSGAGSVRRLVIYAFAYGLLIVAAVGVARVVGLLIPSNDIVRNDSSDIAQALAFTIVGVPGFYVLWRYLNRKLDDPAERRSVGWGLFLLASTTTFLIGGLTGLATGISWIIGVNSPAPVSLGFGIVWTGVWWWTWRLANGARRPEVLEHGSTIVGSGIGLVVTASAAAITLGSLLSEAYDAVFSVSLGSRSSDAFARALVWTIVGVLVWWWHWWQHGLQSPESGGKSAYVLVLGVLGGAVAALGAVAGGLFLTLQWFFGDPDSTSAALHFGDLPAILSTFGIAWLVWAYHRSVVTAEGPQAMESPIGSIYRYLLAGVGLLAAATGLGILVNAIMSTTVTIAGGDSSVDVLLGGLTGLIVGIPVWWKTWTPIQAAVAADPDRIRRPARRVYLTVLAGLGGLVTVISLIVLTFQLFESALEGDSAASVIDQIRGPLGWIVATAVVAGYHFAVWRR
ncbi:MAG: DUF5671 domain-containing protein, partial [Acidimicrobiia bacterium]|nr:DUF5671 domain-containing protein [Acidimicrobiia bacterium]